jgi:hypothetical protein
LVSVQRTPGLGLNVTFRSGLLKPTLLFLWVSKENRDTPVTWAVGDTPLIWEFQG